MYAPQSGKFTKGTHFLARQFPAVFTNAIGTSRWIEPDGRLQMLENYSTSIGGVPACPGYFLSRSGAASFG
jgi:hypothetical protein